MPNVAIVAALEREVEPVIKAWRMRAVDSAGGRLRFLEDADVVLVCGGIGREAARRAAEAVIVQYSPVAIYSVGFAGALDSSLKVGDVVPVSQVIDAADGSRSAAREGDGILVTLATLASPFQKARLRDSYGAQMVDMEGAAVWRAAEAHGLPFSAVKVISDEHDFALPEIERFIDSQGRFQQGRFIRFAVLRPWLWSKVIQLARNSRHAAAALSDWLMAARARIISSAAELKPEAIRAEGAHPEGVPREGISAEIIRREIMRP